MKIENCEIETSKQYQDSEDEEDRPAYGGSYKNVIILKIPIPGGKVIFKYTITSEEATSLENASKLAKNTK